MHTVITNDLELCLLLQVMRGHVNLVIEAGPQMATLAKIWNNDEEQLFNATSARYVKFGTKHIVF